MKQLSNLLRTFEGEMGIVCDEKRCTASAIWVVVVHQLDMCNTEPPYPRWTAVPYGTGNRVFLLCGPCSDEIVAKVGDKVARMRSQLPPDVWLECTGCGMRIESEFEVYAVESLLNV